MAPFRHGFPLHLECVLRCPTFGETFEGFHVPPVRGFDCTVREQAEKPV
jgi:hypothetical protein